MRKEIDINLQSTISLDSFESQYGSRGTTSELRDGDYYYSISGSPDVATITRYVGPGGDITIPSTLGGFHTVAIGPYSFQKCPKITSVIIPDGVETIGHLAFKDCISMTSVSIPDSVGSIGVFAFYNCTNLSAVNIPNRLTTIPYQAFFLCESLTSIDIPECVTSIEDYAFYSSGLKSVTIPISVRSIGINVFGFCKDLAAIIVDPGNLYYSSAGGVLYDKDKRTLIQYPCGGTGGAFNVPNTVRTIGFCAFRRCNALTSLLINSNVTVIENGAFCDCPSLVSINVSQRNQKFASFEGVLYDKYYNKLIQCPGAKSGALIIKSRVTSIGQWALLGCVSLTSVDIPASVTTIGYSAFQNCISMTSITIPDNVICIEDAAFAGCDSLNAVTIPNKVVSIGQAAFYGCDELTSVILSSGLISIGEDAFRYCGVLRSITFLGRYAPTVVGVGWISDTAPDVRGHAYTGSDFPNEGEEWNGLMMGSAIFEDYIYTIDQGRATITGYQGPGGAVIIPATLCGSVPVIAIGDNAFNSAMGHTITSLIIGNKIVSIGDSAFYDSDRLNKVTISESVTFIGNKAFSGCPSLTDIVVNARNKDYASVQGVLYDKHLTTLIQCPGGKQGALSILRNVTSICDHSISGCAYLTSVSIPYKVASIKSGTFNDCASLNELIIGRGVIAIEKGSIQKCPSLKSIIFYGLVAPIDVDINWILGSKVDRLGHAYSYSNFPDPGDKWNGLTMGSFLPDEFEYQISNGKATITSYIGSSKDVEIPSALKGFEVSAIGQKAFNNNVGHAVISLVMPSTVRSIGDHAFQYCTALSDLTIGEHVTTISEGAFQFCRGLRSVIIPGEVQYIDGWSFDACSNLSSATLGGEVRYIGVRAFGLCTKLTSITIPNKVETIDREAFYGCTSLASVTIGSGVVTIGSYSFARCSALTSMNFLSINPPLAGIGWCGGTAPENKGHAYPNSNFPEPGQIWAGLMMGEHIQ